MLLTHVRRTLCDFSNDDCEIFNEKNAIRLIIAGIISTFDTICLCRHNSISFSCMIFKSRVSKCYYNINI